MRPTALFIRHTAKPGMRDDVRRIWEKYVRSYVTGNDEHLAYFYCYDDSNPDIIDVFQLHASRDGGKAFTEQSWYPAYEKETAALLAGPSELRTASPQWIKGEGEAGRGQG